MPYEVTAARKRPQSFEQLAGQEFVAATLEKSLETGRIAHAYLFSGPRGCGKTSTARILAKALNCERGMGAQPCGVCDSCRSIAAGSSLDVIEIDGASNTSVDNVRQIKDEVLFPPNASRYKIYIIDEVHMLSTSAFNALLKTIEEPPPYVVFMFATTEPHKVPATIKSRCQQFTFRLVSSEVIRDLLAQAGAELGVSAEDEALLWIARESGGSIRDAYTLFDQVVSFAEGNITAALIREKLGLVGQDRMNSLFAAFVAGDTPRALAQLDEILSSGVSPEQFVADTVEYARALLLIAHGVTREGVLGAPLGSFDRAIVEALGGEKIERSLSIFLSAYRGLKDSIDPRYELDLAVAKASHIASYVAPGELAEAVATMRSMLEGRAVQPRQAPRASGMAPSGAAAAVRQPVDAQRVAEVPHAADATRVADATRAANAERAAAVVPPSSAPVQAQPARDSAATVRSGGLDTLKRDLVSEIRKNNALLATTLDKSRGWALSGDVLTIAVGTSMECDLLRRFVGIVAEVLSRLSGSPRKIEVQLAGASAGASTGASTGASAGASAGAVPQTGAFPSGTPPARVQPQAERQVPAAAPAPPETYEADDRPLPEDEASGFPEATRAAPARKFSDSSPSIPSEDRERIALVERYFKGSLKGVADLTAPESRPEVFAPAAGNSGGDSDPIVADPDSADPVDPAD